LKIIAFIPARYAASRFPGKLMNTIGGKSIIRMVYENALQTGLFDEVVVVTDSEIIYNEISLHGGLVKMSVGNHNSGSDRIAEVAANMDVDVVVNIQGDEPFVEKEPLESLVAAFKDNTVLVASLMKRILDEEEIKNPNIVKVVCNNKNDALYFSRSVIPFFRNTSSNMPTYKHIGVYAFRKDALLQFTKWNIGKIENTEMLEQLRYLENGVSIKMIETESASIGIDTPEDLELARRLYKER
jgi:3-deoxy-manno-octulosonate cytidylyltransferase (CMP-KDO synthetase)